MLTPAQQKLILDKDLFFEKKRITQNIYADFEELKHEVENHLLKHFSIVDKYILKTGKINRGENLDGLPWINLDYPGYFQKENVFAIRYLFWWGNFFSVTLHLGGTYLDTYSEALTKNILQKQVADAYWCVNNTPWKYNYAADNYIAIKNCNRDLIDKAIRNNFIKVSMYADLKQLNGFKNFGVDSAKQLLALLH